MKKSIIIAISLFISTIISNVALAKNIIPTLYYTPGACSFASRIVINELGLKYNFESVDLNTHIVNSTKENFYDINKKGGVPALTVSNNESLTENGVIMQYLADKDSKHRMLPAIGKIERYRVLEMMNVVSMDLHKVVGLLFHTNLADSDKAQIMTDVKKTLSFFDKSLENKTYLVGNNFSIADSYLFTALTWMPYIKVDLSEFKNLDKFYNNHKTRPSIELAFAQEKDNK